MNFRFRRRFKAENPLGPPQLASCLTVYRRIILG
jgi:hypothetical protein